MPRPGVSLRGRELVLLATVTVVAVTAVVTAVTRSAGPGCRPASVRVLAAVVASLGAAPPPGAPPLADPVPLTPGARLVDAFVLDAEGPALLVVGAYVEDRGDRHGPAVWEVVDGPAGRAEPVVRDRAAAALSPALGADLADDAGVVAAVRACARDGAA